MTEIVDTFQPGPQPKPVNYTNLSDEDLQAALDVGDSEAERELLRRLKAEGPADADR